MRGVIFVILLTLAFQAGAGGRDGPDLELICPCDYSAVSSSAVTAKFGVLNRGSRASRSLVLRAYAHDARNYFTSTDKHYLGDIPITSSLGAAKEIAPDSYTLRFRRPSAGTYFITFLLLENNVVKDVTVMSEQVTFGTVASTTYSDLYFVTDPTISINGSTMTLDMPAIGNSGTEATAISVVVGATRQLDFFAEGGTFYSIGDYTGVTGLAAGSQSKPGQAEFDISGIPEDYGFYHVLVSDGRYTLLMHALRAPGVEFASQDFAVTSVDYLTDSDGDGVADDSERLVGTDPTLGSSTPGTSYIDVLAVYDVGVENEYDGDPSARLDHLFAVANLALADSGVDMKLRLVGQKKVTMDTSQTITQWLQAAENNEGAFADLEQTRIETGADLVTMFRQYDGGDICGLASLGGYGTQGFLTRSEHLSANFIEFDQCGDITMIHEMGHNMGLGHSSRQDETGTFIWSRGYGVRHSFATLMAYASEFDVSSELAVFANPNLKTCEGQPCGEEVDADAPAHAAKSLNVVRHQVASFTQSKAADSDNDGIPDTDDLFPNDAAESIDTDEDGLGNNADYDDDNDGIPDSYELLMGYDPLVSDSSADADNDGKTNLAEYEALPSATQFMQTTSTSRNIARLHLVNTSDVTQQFTGTLFNLEGARLGPAHQSLGASVPPRGRLILDSGQLETIFGLAPWRGPAMLEVIGTGSFVAMSKLVSPSGLVSNSNCVREDRVLNIEGTDSDNTTFVRLINTLDNGLGRIRGTLYDRDGAVLGTPNVELLSGMAPKEMVWLNRARLETLFDTTWEGEALLEVTEYDGLKLLNLNFVNNETFFNFSCFEQGSAEIPGRAYLQTSTLGSNISDTHIVNTGDAEQRFTATLYNKSGEQLGEADQVIGTAAARGRIIVSSADLERIFNISPWQAPAMLEVKGTGNFELMTKQTSASGLVSNVNCVRQDQVHNIEGFDSPDVTYIRFINTSSEPVADIRGTLFDSAGDGIGPANQVLMTLQPREQRFLSRDQLAALFDDATWNGEAMLQVDASSPVQLLNLNYINSETFFNFSCYEPSN
jgi:hypothetical protein